MAKYRESPDVVFRPERVMLGARRKPSRLKKRVSAVRPDYVVFQKRPHDLEMSSPKVFNGTQPDAFVSSDADKTSAWLGGYGY